MEKELKSITQDELDDMTEFERADLELSALRTMDKGEREKLENEISEAGDHYRSTVEAAISDAGEELAETMAELRQQFGTLIVDAILKDNWSLGDLTLCNDGPAKRIAEVEEDHQFKR